MFLQRKQPTRVLTKKRATTMEQVWNLHDKLIPAYCFVLIDLHITVPY